MSLHVLSLSKKGNPMSPARNQQDLCHGIMGKGLREGKKNLLRDSYQRVAFFADRYHWGFRAAD
jgi:hypothetical protein